MKQFFRVFRFEYGNYAKDKIFIGLTAVLLALVTAVLFFPRFKGEDGGSIFAGESEAPEKAEWSASSSVPFRHTAGIPPGSPG